MDDLSLRRITIQVTKSQHEKLKSLGSPGLSISSIIRNSIDNYISSLDKNNLISNSNYLSNQTSFSQIGDNKISDSASLNLETELIQIESLKTKNLISNEEYKLLRKKLLGL